MSPELQLVSSVICDDVLLNAANRLSLYAVFRDLWADGFPARVVRLHVVTTWYNGDDVPGELIERVTIATPDGETLVGESVTTVSVDAEAYHTQVSRFRDLTFPHPGAYRVQVQAGPRRRVDLPLVVVGPDPEEVER